MLNDSTMLSAARMADSGDRRADDRAQASGEIVLLWHHEPETLLRYQLIDRSAGGVRLHTRLPLREGMTGLALRILPEGEPIERPVMVSWIKRFPGAEYEIGLSFIDPV